MIKLKSLLEQQDKIFGQPITRYTAFTDWGELIGYLTPENKPHFVKIIDSKIYIDEEYKVLDVGRSLLDPILKDKKADIHIMCRSGKRSMNACLFLEENGYSNLFNCEGGIIEWIESGFEVK